MALLHRAGLAGLWMTLRQLEEQNSGSAQIPGGLAWSLSPDRIELDWRGNDFTILDWLFKQSFQLNNDGLITLAGLGPHTLNPQTQLVAHQGITGTFLQHPQFLKTAGKTTKILEIGDQRIAVEYRRVVSYTHQNFAAALCDRQGNLLKHPIGIVGWLYPGAVVRHYRFSKETKFEETPELALALPFACIACQYFILPKHLQKGRAQYALVIPDVENLEEYASHFWASTAPDYLELHVSGMGDAGLKWSVQQAAKARLRKSTVKRCQVISFGQVAWSAQQKTKVEVIDLEVDEDVLAEYQMSCEIFGRSRIIQYPTWQKVVASYAHRIITENLAQGNSWWTHFFEYVNDPVSLREIFRECNGWFTMIEQTQWDDPAKKLFIKACHEALRRTYAQIYSRTPDDEYVKIRQKNQRFLSELNRCKDVHTFRHFINTFFAKAGLNTLLQKHWEDLLPIMSGETDWRITRDLLLLAMASYQPADSEPKKAGDADKKLQPVARSTKSNKK